MRFLTIVLAILPISCRDQCIASCPETVAAVVSVTAAGATGPVAGAFIQASGPMNGMASCRVESGATACYVPGPLGTYVLDVGAPGFQTMRRTVDVRGEEGETCRCPTTSTARLTVSLAPTPAP